MEPCSKRFRKQDRHVFCLLVLCVCVCLRQTSVDKASRESNPLKFELFPLLLTDKQVILIISLALLAFQAHSFGLIGHLLFISAQVTSIHSCTVDF